MGPAARRTRWGAHPEQWAAAVEEARACLESRARARQTIAYSELCDCIRSVRLRPYSWGVTALLCEVTSEQDIARGVSLAALVVRRDTGMPGDGYFTVGGYPVAPEARETAWREDARRVWDAYGAGEDDPDAVVL